MQQIWEKQFFLQKSRSWYYIQTNAAEFRYFKAITIIFSYIQTVKIDVNFLYQKSLTHSFVFNWKINVNFDSQEILKIDCNSFEESEIR